MIALEDLYFEWLLTVLSPEEGALEEVSYVGDLLHNCVFSRRVGHDINRALDGVELRKTFLRDFDEFEFEPHVTNALMNQECSWFEMLVALCQELDFLYEGGVEGRFVELLTNVSLDSMFHPGARQTLRAHEHNRRLVGRITHNIDNNKFDSNGHGGLFPLDKPTSLDQRGVEIWDQQAAYFRERLEGVLF